MVNHPESHLFPPLGLSHLEDKVPPPGPVCSDGSTYKKLIGQNGMKAGLPSESEWVALAPHPLAPQFNV